MFIYYYVFDVREEKQRFTSRFKDYFRERKKKEKIRGGDKKLNK